MGSDLVTGWDVGGAHLKVAQATRDGGDGKPRLTLVRQFPCRLWEGLDRLRGALVEAQAALAPGGAHAVTMTGELVDYFSGRAEGVTALLAVMRETFPEADLRVYAGRAGFLEPEAAAARPLEVASANWLASVALTAARLESGLFLDVGSTTTDILAFAGGKDRARGLTDADRLASEELVYTGVARTPVMALAGRVPFEGQWQGVMAEYFATLADVHRLTGELPEEADLHPAADGKEKTLAGSQRRLARMLGRDCTDQDLPAYRRLAAHLAGRQVEQIRLAAERVLSGAEIGEEAPLVGAGVGRFLLPRLAAALGRPYVDFAELVEGPEALRRAAAHSAPAAAVALLAAG